MAAGDLGRGIDVLLSIGGVEIGGQRDANFKGSTDLIDATHKGTGGFKRYLLGNLGGTIDLDCVMVEGNAGQASLWTAFLNKTTVAASLALPDGTAVTGDVVLGDLSLAGPQGDVGTYSCTLTFDDTIAHA